MNTSKKQPVTLKDLNYKLIEEAKRIVKIKEDGAVKFVSKKANLVGNSTLLFKNKNGENITISLRLNKDGNLRLAYESRFSNL
ncbi:MAG: hypothetical protein AAB405_01670 [Patescibacteria group bacterium]